jgi:hypothetical protein
MAKKKKSPGIDHFVTPDDIEQLKKLAFLRGQNDALGKMEMYLKAVRKIFNAMRDSNSG